MTAVIPGAPDYAAMNYNQAFSVSESKDRDGALAVLWVDARAHHSMILSQERYRSAVDVAYRRVLQRGVPDGVDPTDEVEQRAMDMLHGEAIDDADDRWWKLEAPECTCQERDMLQYHFRGCPRAVAIRVRYHLAPL